MANRTQPKYKNVMWIGHHDMAMALFVNRHNHFLTVDDATTGEEQYLFKVTKRLLSDIKKYEAGTLRVNARQHCVWLTGRFYD